MYCIVSKFNPTRLGSRNVFLVKSHVPSPTTMVLDEYEADPGGESESAGAMVGKLASLLARAAPVEFEGLDSVRVEECQRCLNGYCV